MTDLSWQTFAKWGIVLLLTILLVAGFIYGLIALERSTGPDQAGTERAISHACDPLKNTQVDYHGPSWSESGRYEVTCSDGSQRIVYPK